MRESGRDRAYRAIRDMVLSDPGLAGSFVNEQEIADTLGVSRTPVREALLLLAGEDLVSLVPGRGALVLSPTPKQVREILQAREMIELWALSIVLEPGARIDDPLPAMRDCLSRQRQLLSEGARPKEFIEADREFHTHLVAAAGNSAVEAMYEVLRARHVVIGTEAIVQHMGRAQDVVAEHAAIIDAMDKQDGGAASDALRRHLEQTLRSLTP